MATAKLTDAMQTAGLDWPGIDSVVEHVVALLEREGQAAASLVRNTLKLVQAVSGRDLTTILAALGEVNVDVQKIVSDIRAEFGI